ncbi:MAG: type II secretion system F family protein [Chloroflexi bacterium]|nr:type II secretion system F family protein [Chloroflexota bacterium]
MPYRYLAAAADGRLVQGTVEAPREQEAQAALAQAGYTVVSLRRVLALPRWDQVFPSLLGVKPGDLVAFCRHLALLLEAGTPLLHALHLLHDHSRKASLRAALAGVAAAVEQGNTLAHALESEAPAFPHLLVRLVQVGERTGDLEGVLRQLASYLEGEQRLAKKLGGALVYPAIVLALAAGVVGLMVTVVLPPLQGLFESFAVELPLTTRLALGTTGWLADNLAALGLAGVTAALVAGVYLRREDGRRRAQALLLRLPVLGSLVLDRHLGRSARMAALLLRAGVPIQEMLEQLAQASGNLVIRDALLAARRQVLGGARLGEGLAQGPLAAPLFLQLVQVGEETGTLDRTLEAAASFYEQLVEDRLGQMVSLLEPALTLLVGGVVAFLALSVVTPIVSITGAIQ